MSRKWHILSLIPLILLLISLSYAQDDQPTFRIGAIDTEDGAITNGAQLAITEINNAGGVVGADGTVFRLELVTAAPAGETDIEEAIESLQEANVIAVLGPPTTDQVLSNLELLQGLEIPVITPATGDTILASDNVENLFQSRAAEFFQGSALAAYIADDLQLDDVITIQLDVASTAAVLGFTSAAEQAGIAPREALLYETGTELEDLVEQVIELNPQVAVTYGPPETTAEFYTALRQGGWSGNFAYDGATATEFRESVPDEERSGVLSVTTWALDSLERGAALFRDTFVRTFAEVPGPVEAAAYDSIALIEIALSQPGELGDNLAAIEEYEGAQGILRPATLGRGELSTQVAVTQLNALGGADLLARYEGGVRIPNEALDLVEDVTAPTPTATPEGVVITIRNNVQNVRSGPGFEYEVLGQLQQGQQAQVIGATTDFDWVVIEYRGQNGWLATYLLEVFGDRSTVPVLTPPPTPTPGPGTPSTPGTAIPGTPPFGVTPSPSLTTPDLIVTSITPNSFTVNSTATVNITVRNQGGVAAGAFAIGGSFTGATANNEYQALNLTGLAPGVDQTVQLTFPVGTVTGSFSTTIVVDFNQQVDEGPTGEANNNTFVYVYRIDQPVQFNNSAALSPGTGIDLDAGGTQDIRYDAAGLNSTGTCTAGDNPTGCIGLIGQNYDTITFDQITGSTVNQVFIPNSSLTPGVSVGFFTAEGRRGVLRVDAVNPGVSISFTYRVYQ